MWVQAIPKIQYALAHTPCTDTLLSPATMLLGHAPRNPVLLMQKGRLQQADDLDKKLMAVRQRQIDRANRLKENPPPKRQYKREAQYFEPGDWVRIKAEKPSNESLKRGIPLKWIFKWEEKGRIVERVPNHPDQYLVRKNKTGRIVKRSGSTLVRIPDPPLIQNVQEAYDVEGRQSKETLQLQEVQELGLTEGLPQDF